MQFDHELVRLHIQTATANISLKLSERLNSTKDKSQLARDHFWADYDLN